jgi:hypothetical protein
MSPDLVFRQTLLGHSVVALFPRMACRGWSPAVGYGHLAVLVGLGALRPFGNLLPKHFLSSIPDLYPLVLPNVLAAVKQWRFRPYEASGRRVSVLGYFDFCFSISGCPFMDFQFTPRN